MEVSLPIMHWEAALLGLFCQQGPNLVQFVKDLRRKASSSWPVRRRAECQEGPHCPPHPVGGLCTAWVPSQAGDFPAAPSGSSGRPFGGPTVPRVPPPPARGPGRPANKEPQVGPGTPGRQGRALQVLNSAMERSGGCWLGQQPATGRQRIPLPPHRGGRSGSALATERQSEALCTQCRGRRAGPAHTLTRTSLFPGSGKAQRGLPGNAGTVLPSPGHPSGLSGTAACAEPWAGGAAPPPPPRSVPAC